MMREIRSDYPYRVSGDVSSGGGVSGFLTEYDYEELGSLENFRNLDTRKARVCQDIYKEGKDEGDK